MDNQKPSCFGSHKVILVEESAEGGLITYSINPECVKCPQFRACRKSFLSGEGKYILDRLSKPPVMKMDYSQVDECLFYFIEDIGFSYAQFEEFIEHFMDFIDRCHGKVITYESFSKYFVHLNYPQVDEKGFMLLLQVLTGEKLFTEH